MTQVAKLLCSPQTLFNKLLYFPQAQFTRLLYSPQTRFTRLLYSHMTKFAKQLHPSHNTNYKATVFPKGHRLLSFCISPHDTVIQLLHSPQTQITGLITQANKLLYPSHVTGCKATVYPHMGRVAKLLHCPHDAGYYCKLLDSP